MADSLNVPALSKLADVPIRTIEDIEKRGDCKFSTALKLATALKVYRVNDIAAGITIIKFYQKAVDGTRYTYY